MSSRSSRPPWPGHTRDAEERRAKALAARIAGHVEPTDDEKRKARNKRKAGRK